MTRWDEFIARPFPRLAPSVLDSDLATLAGEVGILESAGIDVIHVDVMDGHFVPNISIGIPVVASLREHTDRVLDVHLMIEEPERYVEAFVEAGADIVTVHVEATPHVRRAIDLIHDAGARAGVTLNPGTPINFAVELVPVVDLVLVMSISPGFGGQEFQPDALARLQAVRRAIDGSERRVLLEVDGGVNVNTIEAAVSAGSDLLVAGSAIFKHESGPQAGLRDLLARLSRREGE